MIVIIDDYQIKPYYDYCYRVAKRKGKKQWRTLGYYDYLSQAAEGTAQNVTIQRHGISTLEKNLQGES